MVYKYLRILWCSGILISITECSKKSINLDGLVRQENCANDPGGQFNAERRARAQAFLQEVVDGPVIVHLDSSTFKRSTVLEKKVQFQEEPEIHLIEQAEEPFTEPTELVQKSEDTCWRRFMRVFHAMKRRDRRGDPI